MLIIDTILTWFSNLILGAVNKFPSITQYNPDSGQLSGMIGLVSQCAYFLPLGTMAACLAAIVLAHGILNSAWVVNWVVKRIRGG